MHNKYIVAGLLILLGTALLLDQYHVWTLGRIISTWWPLILIGIGTSSIISHKGHTLSGYLILLIGIIFQAQRLDWISGSIWGYLWPLALIFIGLHILFSEKGGKKKILGMDKDISDKDTININTVFSGIEERIDSQSFVGGDVNVFFAGVELDLRPAKFKENIAFLSLNVTFGSIVIRVPNDIILEMQGSPFLGGFENKTNQKTSSMSKILKIKYSAAFGSIEITN